MKFDIDVFRIGTMARVAFMNGSHMSIATASTAEQRSGPNCS